ncbi:MAG: DNA cytosine methyltransferase [Mesorhizobium sp.]|nr:MAG: DNA cytosine methyltransferase [Mesorhizobium sp.]RWN73227.1 MAG: DNA cytosine methyltransferase [Mesorhizobium sp.]RWN85234.1 MAG: DNA cytosine methyltransferase [Mesorhizobium sp.]
MFSGIEAASVAFTPLGWRALVFAEIEKFPSAVLAYHYPEVPNVGDMAAHDWSHYRGKVDIVCGGPPCQAFSVAGLRNSLEDARGNLSLVYMRALHAINPRNAIIENVPGWLNTPDNAFGCFLGGLVGADDAIPPPPGRNGKRNTKWPDAGMVSGPGGRAAWRILDAQFFGLAQRRKRVIVVADFGNGADPAAVLFERVGMQGNSAPSREKREGIAVSPSLRARANSSHRLDSQAYVPEIARCVATREGSSQDYETTTMVSVEVAPTMRAGGNSTGGDRPYGTDVDTCDSLAVVSQQVYSIMPQNSGKDYKARPVEVAQPVMAAGQTHGNQGGDVVCVTGTVTHTLKAEGADASEDGTGRGTPIVSVFDPNQITRSTNRSKPTPEPCHTLPAVANSPICFTAKDYGADASEDIAPTLRAGTHDKSHANGGVTPAVTVALRGRDGGATAELGGSIATALRASSGGGDKPHVLTSAVRRLTPMECERLQGFPDGYTDIPWRGKPSSPDGPRYKALGNSWAVPKFRWLGQRIQRFMPPLVANDNQPTELAA